MKRKIITLFLATAVAASAVTGCGNEAAEEVKTTAEESTEIEITEAETAEVAESTEESAEDKPSDDGLYSKMETGIYKFDDSTAKIYSDQYTLKEDETKAVFTNCAVSENGYAGSFSFTGPKELGKCVFLSDDHSQFTFSNSNTNSTMNLWVGLSPSTQEEVDEMIAMDKETITGFANPACPYSENGYYSRESTDDYLTWKYAVENDNEKGYEFYKLRLSDGACYQFEYTESKTIYDENRVNDLLNSIRIENYTEADWENME